MHIPNVLLEPSGLFSQDITLRSDDFDDTKDSYGKHKDNMGDEEKDNYEEKQARAASFNVPNWPKSIYAYLKLGYDNTLANQMRAQGTTFEKWVDSVMTHVQTYYRHKSLPTKIQLKVSKIYFIIHRLKHSPIPVLSIGS